MAHLKSLRWVNFAIGAYTFVAGLLFLILFLLPGLIGDDDVPWLVFALMGVGVFVLLGGLAVAHVVVGYLVGSGRGRIVQTLLALMQLASFPVGTAYALYALWVCWACEEAGRRFDTSLKPPIR